jgi:hypothetical protein
MGSVRLVNKTQGGELKIVETRTDGASRPFEGNVSIGFIQATPGDMKSFRSSAERMALMVGEGREEVDVGGEGRLPALDFLKSAWAMRTKRGNQANQGLPANVIQTQPGERYGCEGCGTSERGRVGRKRCRDMVLGKSRYRRQRGRGSHVVHFQSSPRGC